jgi:hypothetical protein
MPEYGTDLLPLWGRSPEGGGGLHEDDIGVSDHLAARLREWNARWAAHRPEESHMWSAKEESRWLETGYRLAWQLQSELTDIAVLIMDDTGAEVAISDTW